jgi:zinc and cadmium transporter
VPCLISYAIGTLSAGAFLGLIPAALEQMPVKSALLAVIAGIVAFFVLEKMLLWRHCHEERCTIHGTVSGPMILLGDAVHNFVDGAVIAASFVVSIPLGIVSSLAVIAHEIPQEVADFAVLLQSGYSRQKAFLYNTISASTTIAGGILAYVFVYQLEIAVPLHYGNFSGEFYLYIVG